MSVWNLIQSTVLPNKAIYCKILLYVAFLLCMYCCDLYKKVSKAEGAMC